jgi:thioredoxin-like negative regulator of GroEL
MQVVPVNEQTFELEVMAESLPVLVEFGAEWCGPCKAVAPEMKALAAELDGKAKIATVDIDHCPNLSRQIGVQSVPTFVVFSKQMRAMLEPHFPRAAGALKAAEVAQLLTRGQISMVDTRDAAVFARAHIKGAVNLPADELKTRLAELAMLATPPVLYCRGGDRAKALSEELAKEGQPVAFLEGGVLDWEASGFELDRPD